MNPFVFVCPTRVSFGEGLAAGACEVLQEFRCTKTLIVTDAFLLSNGIIKEVLAGFDSAKFPYVVFSDVPPDSDIDIVNRAADIARSQKCDSVLAIGGGSVIDTAKVVAVSLTYGGDVREYQGLNNLEKALVPLFAIPTTAGTGSEVSFAALVKDSEEHKKLLYASRYLAPLVSILDPTLLLSLPPKLTAATGLDAITHNIESFTAVATNSVLSDSLSIKSMRLLLKHLERATKHGDDMEARSATLVASTMAGLAFTNAGVGIVHALAHSTGARFNTHHGATNCVFLPHGMRFNKDVVAARYAEMARSLGVSSSLNDNEASDALIACIEELTAKVGLPGRLRDLGVPKLSESQLAELADLTATDPAIMFNPKDSSIEDIIGIYERAY